MRRARYCEVKFELLFIVELLVQPFIIQFLLVELLQFELEFFVAVVVKLKLLFVELELVEFVVLVTIIVVEFQLLEFAVIVLVEQLVTIIVVEFVVLVQLVVLIELVKFEPVKLFILELKLEFGEPVSITSGGPAAGSGVLTKRGLKCSRKN